jgi:hypothetical protein
VIELWRALFLQLFAILGQTIDKSGAHSILDLATKAKRYAGKGSDLGKIATQITKEIIARKSLEKVRAWRNHVVAHRTADGQVAAFFEYNKMDLDEIEALITFLEKKLNELSVAAINTRTFLRDVSKFHRQQCESMFEKLAAEHGA